MIAYIYASMELHSCMILFHKHIGSRFTADILSLDFTQKTEGIKKSTFLIMYSGNTLVMGEICSLEVIVCNLNMKENAPLCECSKDSFVNANSMLSEVLACSLKRIHIFTIWCK